MSSCTCEYICTRGTINMNDLKDQLNLFLLKCAHGPINGLTHISMWKPAITTPFTTMFVYKCGFPICEL